MFGDRYVDEEMTKKQADDDNTTILVGRRVLAPSYDGIPAWIERSVFIPVNEAGEPIHPEDRTIVGDDSVPTEQRGIIVYLPSYFRTRVSNLLVNNSNNNNNNNNHVNHIFNVVNRYCCRFNFYHWTM
jgi:hypothetical protein